MARAIARGFGFVLGLGVAGALGGACSPASEGVESGTGGTGVAQGGSAGAGMGGSDPLGGAQSGGVSGTTPIITSGASGSGGSGDITACAGHVTKGELVPVDMFVMLDISGSMLEMTDTGSDKWTAVKNALHAFLSDAGSAGLGVGIQYFPLEKSGVPDSCTSNADCGSSAPCFLRVCWGALSTSGQSYPCETDADCQSIGGSVGPCMAFGQCSGDRSYLCQTPGLPCITVTQSLGTCVAPVSICINTAECEASAYATPAVPIETLPDAAPALIASIDAQMPNGQTPTGPALTGAIEQARTHATLNPSHAVVAVLATDGLPTRCEPLEIEDISGVASAAVAATPSVRTFVIGVFGPEDTGAPENLDAIARGGGTEAAFIVDTSQNVSEQFLAALAEIRGTSLGCEFQIPAPALGERLDYALVNVDFTEGTTKTRLYKVTGRAACAADGGWYYDDEAAPTRIILCPASCTRAEGATDAAVEIQLGCKTDVR